MEGRHIQYGILCVDCKTPSLLRVVNDGLEYFKCKKCNGCWFRRLHINRFLRKHAESNQTLRSLADACRETKDQNCPDCKLPLKEYRFSKDIVLTVRICDSCNGIWSEDDKLRQFIFLDQKKQLSENDRKSVNLSTLLFQIIFLVPIEHNIKPRRFPIVTVTIITGCFFMFLCQLLSERFSEFLSLKMPMQGFFQTSFNLFTYQFLHGSWAHLFGNMYFLLILGRHVEDIMSPVKYFLFYILTGVVGGLFFTLLHHDALELSLIGASGSISGIIGLYSTIYRKAKMTILVVFLPIKINIYGFCALWIVSNLLLSLSDQTNVAWQVHLVGFFIGFAYGKLRYHSLVADRPALQYINEPQ